MIKMASSINAAFSTMDSEAQAGRDTAEKQQSIAIDSVPVLDMPHRWDENGDLIPDSSPAPCPRCKWSGDPEDFICEEGLFASPTRLYAKDCQDGPFECVRCEILRLLLRQASQDVGHEIQDTTCITICDGHIGYLGRLQRGIDDAVRQIFISDDSQSSTIAKYGITRRCMVSTGARWARDLISECISSHQACQSQFDGKFLPTRLINIQPNSEGGNPRLKLQSSRAVPARSPYVALSYCWGGYVPACMTIDVHGKPDDELRPLPWNDLPQTFQDAVNFTLGLGVNFLWIDSICIIQGDYEDWSSEAPKMHSVYKNSYVTVAALCGRDSTNGLSTHSLRQTLNPIAQLRTGQSTHILYTRPCHYLDDWIQDDAGEHSELHSRYPLLRRAWTYQERLVSSRVIFFTESEMIYQCLCHVTCECGASQDYYSREVLLSGLDQRKIWSATQGNLNNCMEDERVATVWRRNVVYEYSQLDVSKSRDRLPAIGAIAEQFQGIRVGEEYLAGLWSKTLLKDLLWNCVDDRVRVRQYFVCQKTFERYEGLPTWTWASVRSQVDYCLDYQVVHKAKVVQAHCDYTHNKTFGTLEKSHLRLEGRVLVCMLEWVEITTNEEDCLKNRLSFKDENGWTAIDDQRGYDLDRDVAIMMDYDQDGLHFLPHQQFVHIMEISVGESGMNKQWHFLLLRLKAGSPGKGLETEAYFTRGGVVEIAQRSREFDHGSSLTRESSPVNSPSEQWQPDWFETVMENHSEWMCCEIR